VLAVAAGRAIHITVHGDGSAVRDFVHVDDVARAFVAAIAAADPGQHTVCNVGAVPASVRDIIEAAQRVTGAAIPVRYLPANPGEARMLRADTTRIRDVLGWQPRHSTVDAIIADDWSARHGSG
jgi:UDP-glucose 4-epimerase